MGPDAALAITRGDLDYLLDVTRKKWLSSFDMDFFKLQIGEFGDTARIENHGDFTVAHDRGAGITLRGFQIRAQRFDDNFFTVQQFIHH